MPDDQQANGTLQTVTSAFVYDFLHTINDPHEEKIGKNDAVQCAEDLILKIAPARLGISPVGIHLFALFHPKSKIWLCPSQKLATFLDDSKVNDFNLQLRIRFLPCSSIDLRRDSKAFEYYFHQIRDDFINFPKKHFESFKGFESEVYGIALQDELRIVIENKTAIDDSNIKSIVEDIYKHLPKNMPTAFFDRFFPIKSKLENLFMDSYCKNLNENYVKSCYINQYLNSIAKNYYDETYRIVYHNPKYKFPPRQKIITYKVWSQEVCIKNAKNDVWEMLFALKDLMYITAEDKTIHISHVNGAPITLLFENSMKMRSFISLLSGYYRLSQRWNFKLCKEYFSPWIERLRKISCHGPVSSEFIREKLQSYSDNSKKHLQYVFQQSKNNFETFFLVFHDKKYVVEADLRKKNATQYKLVDFNKTFSSHQELLEFMEKLRPPCIALPLNERDMPLNLLFCRVKGEPLKKEKSDLIVLSYDEIEKSKLVSTKNRLFCIRFGKNKKDEKVTIKEFVNNYDVGNFLNEITQWIHLQDNSLVNCRGITLSPFSILSEFCQTSLQELLAEHKPTNNMLLQATFSLAKALDYIYNQGFVHGFIRFENLYVSRFDDKTLSVKLGDPIGYSKLRNHPAEVNKERPWLPPEFFNPISLHYQKLTSFVDVWAFGTTVVQIFNCGQHISLGKAPKEVANLIGQCWHPDFNQRIQPFSILGDMSHILAQDSSVYHYQKIQDSDQCDTPNFVIMNSLKPRLRKKFSFSSLSISSAQTDTTLLNTLDETFSIYNSQNLRDLYDLDKIDGFQLSLFEQIGKGNYGNVFKATLQKQSPITVAVKIINENETQSLDHEMRIMTKLKHKNIVQILGYCYIDSDCLYNAGSHNSSSPSSGQFKGLVMEYLEMGALNSYLNRKYAENQLDLPFTKFATDIAEGLAFLASKSIVHRDLAARNILMKSETELKISDFGLSHIIENNYYKLQSERPIPIKWYAPESIEYHKFLIKSDVWSYAVLLWEIYTFCKAEPYGEINYTEFANHLLEGNRLKMPTNCPIKMFAIMEDCWQYESDRRPDFETILERIAQIE